jgi:hypothetical protein
MSETAIIAILGAATTLLATIVSFVYGRRSERQQQTLTIRAKMLEPIEKWLAGAEKISGILGDTLSAVVVGLPLPINYNLEERRLALRFMAENTNSVLGILASKSLQSGRAKGLAKKLTDTILALDNLIKYRLLPLDSEILDRARAENLTPDFVQHVLNTKLKVDALLQNSYSFIAQIKTALT